MTLTIGLTGGIGSGKSTVAKIFGELDVPVFDTDLIARELVVPGSSTATEIRKIFGDEIFLDNDEINREALKQRIFNDDDSRLQLESILHPKIHDRLLSLIASCTSPYCVAVIPLLIEKNWQDVVDRILVVDLAEDEQLKRASSRDNVSETLVSQIVRTQVGRNKRLSYANDIIDNNGSLESLTSQVNELHKKYLSLSKQK